MEQIRQRTRADETDPAELPLIPAPRRDLGESLPAEVDDEVDSDLPAPVATAEGGLDERERHILAFEKQWWRHAGAKEQAIRDSFGVSATRYYQLLNALLDRPAALELEPVLVARLRRLRGSRARTRSTR